jgi:two-component system sensor histidine kinase AdeS
MKMPRFSTLPLATVTATVIATMLVLSVGMTGLGVGWYASYIEQSATDNLPPNAEAAFRTLNEGAVHDRDALKILLAHIETQTDLRIQLAIVVCGLFSALTCATVGIYLSRRIVSPLEELTSAAQTLKEGNFSVRVAASPNSTSEVSSLVESFNALATSLETMEERLRFNNMAIAHELRTPLTILRGSMQGMLDGVFPIKWKTISDLLLQVEGLTRIVEDLRTLSLAIDQKLVLQREKLDVALVVDAILASAEPLLNAAKLQVETRLQPAWISADSSRIRQAVLALLENACRYAASGGWLRCETQQFPDGTVVIRVLDRGPGFPEDLQAVAVNPFWRGDPSRSRATGGTGLGLSVVRAIAFAHGGDLKLANRTGGGAIVEIQLQQERDASSKKL